MEYAHGKAIKTLPRFALHAMQPCCLLLGEADRGTRGGRNVLVDGLVLGAVGEAGTGMGEGERLQTTCQSP